MVGNAFGDRTGGLEWAQSPLPIRLGKQNGEEVNGPAK